VDRRFLHGICLWPTLPQELQKLWNFAKLDGRSSHSLPARIDARSLLDADFVKAYKHGMAIKRFDGVFRRIYPRIFTYSADYPEKWVYVLQ
jgi:hypothetical protein